ncbi:tyrosine-type recombinase/integrase [Endozoicomonas sp. ALE010]|uniref:tyrosine-type recombinase/integrase n=1 Tax=Endozoicomonas sp. ALE010 TaxID=3403081 RepID=UPI003BB5FF85
MRIGITKQRIQHQNNSGQRACDKLIDRRWDKAGEAAGLTGKIDFYGLRHTFGTRLAELRLDLTTTQELMSPDRKHLAVSELGGLVTTHSRTSLSQPSTPHSHRQPQRFIRHTSFTQHST